MSDYLRVGPIALPTSLGVTSWYDISALEDIYFSDMYAGAAGGGNFTGFWTLEVSYDDTPSDATAIKAFKSNALSAATTQVVAMQKIVNDPVQVGQDVNALPLYMTRRFPRAKWARLRAEANGGVLSGAMALLLQGEPRIGNAQFLTRSIPTPSGSLSVDTYGTAVDVRDIKDFFFYAVWNASTAVDCPQFLFVDSNDPNNDTRWAEPAQITTSNTTSPDIMKLGEGIFYAPTIGKGALSVSDAVWCRIRRKAGTFSGTAAYSLVGIERTF